MKQLLILLFIVVISITACSDPFAIPPPSPQDYAEAETIRTANQIAISNAEFARQQSIALAQVLADKPTDYTWLYVIALIVGVVVLVFILVIVDRMYRMSTMSNTYPKQITNIRYITIARVGKGQYQITDDGNTRMLDFKNPVDVGLFQDIVGG